MRDYCRVEDLPAMVMCLSDTSPCRPESVLEQLVVIEDKRTTTSELIYSTTKSQTSSIVLGRSILKGGLEG
jgi:hypothetical protein